MGQQSRSAGRRRALGWLLAAALAVPGAAAAVELGVFADARYQGSSRQGETQGFALGQFDFYGTVQLDERTRAFFEYVFEDGGADVERLWVQRSFGHALRLALGRFHNPVGYWNRHFHHGALLMDTVTRPRFLEFEDAPGATLPMHAVGLLASGELPAGPGLLGYELAVGNSSSLCAGTGDDPCPGELGVHMDSPPTDARMVTARLRFRPAAWPLELALFGLHNPLPGRGTGELAVRQDVLGADLHYEGERLDLTGELYGFRSEDLRGALGTRRAVAWYLQGGWRLAEAWKGVYRFELLNYGQGDPYFDAGYLNDVSPSTRHVLGLRWDLEANHALKLELSRTEPLASSTQSGYTSWWLQWAFLML